MKTCLIVEKYLKLNVYDKLFKDLNVEVKIKNGWIYIKLIYIELISGQLCNMS